MLAKIFNRRMNTAKLVLCLCLVFVFFASPAWPSWWPWSYTEQADMTSVDKYEPTPHRHQHHHHDRKLWSPSSLRLPVVGTSFKKPRAPAGNLSYAVTALPTARSTSPSRKQRRERARTSTVRPTSITRPTPSTHVKTGSKVQRAKVLLVAYYRGGSTLLGTTLNAYEGSFYWFEPLQWIYKNSFVNHRAVSSVQAHGYQVRNQSAKLTQHIRNLHRRVHADLHNIMDCDIGKLRSEVFTQKFVFTNIKGSPARQQYGKCLKTSTPFKCVPILEEECRRAKVVVAKTIRLSVNLASKSVDDDTLIVYQSRDPRGLLASRFVISGLSRTSVTHSARELCSEMLQDYHSIKNLTKTKPEQYMMLRFEDLAAHPSVTTAKLFQFIRQPRTLQVKRWIMGQTQPKTKFEMKHRMSHSVAIANLWQKRLRPDHLDIINRECKEVLQAFGY